MIKLMNGEKINLKNKNVEKNNCWDRNHSLKKQELMMLDDARNEHKKLDLLSIFFPKNVVP